jgi:hypothetical protein
MSAWRSMRRLVVGYRSRMFSASANYIRRDFEKCPAWAADFSEPLTNSEKAVQRRREMLTRRVRTGQGLGRQLSITRNRETDRDVTTTKEPGSRKEARS